MADENTKRSIAETLPGEEDLRFIRNFHDIFLSLGVLMFAAGLGLATAIVVGPRLEAAAEAGGFRGALGLVAAAAGANALVMWLMAEFFARGRRLFLPSIVILLAFSGFTTVAAAAGYGLVRDFDQAFFDNLDQLDEAGAIRQASNFFLFISGVTTLAIFAFYARMRLPFAMGLGALSLTGVGISGVAFLAPEQFLKLLEPAQLAAGVFLFLLGVYFDARDPDRKTRLSDNGFWLHFFAAPMILNTVIGMTVGFDMIERNQTGAAAITLVIVFAFAFVSLLINRRALLVAGLIYALVAIGYLISRVGLSGGWTAALTLLVTGGSMVLLGGGWHAVRRAVVAPFPKTGLVARIIPPEPPGKDRRNRVSE